MPGDATCFWSFAGASDGLVATPPFTRSGTFWGGCAPLHSGPEAGVRALMAVDFFGASGEGGVRSGRRDLIHSQGERSKSS